MTRDRTEAMAAMGILHIVLGAGGAVIAFWSMLDDPDDVAAAAMKLGAVIAWAALAVAGAGVLALKPWARWTAIVAGPVITGLCIASYLATTDQLQLALAGYGVVSAALFFLPRWKQAFTEKPLILFPDRVEASQSAAEAASGDHVKPAA